MFRAASLLPGNRYATNLQIDSIDALISAVADFNSEYPSPTEPPDPSSEMFLQLRNVLLQIFGPLLQWSSRSCRIASCGVHL